MVVITNTFLAKENYIYIYIHTHKLPHMINTFFSPQFLLNVYEYKCQALIFLISCSYTKKNYTHLST
jgi:hypothetical protein